MEIIEVECDSQEFLRNFGDTLELNVDVCPICSGQMNIYLVWNERMVACSVCAVAIPND